MSELLSPEEVAVRPQSQVDGPLHCRASRSVVNGTINRPRPSRATSTTWEGSEDELLDVKQAACLLTVKPSTLAAWAREGRVPVVRLGPRATRWTRPLLREIVATKLDRGRF